MARTKQTARNIEAEKKSKAAVAAKGKAGAVGKAKRKEKERKEAPHRKRRPGSVALTKIRKLQASVDLIIPKLAFQRLVRSIIAQDSGKPSGVDKDGNPRDWKLSESALYGLQTYLEHNMHALFRVGVFAMMHAKRVTLYPRDLALVQFLVSGGVDEIIEIPHLASAKKPSVKGRK